MLQRLARWHPTRLQFLLATALWLAIVPNLATLLSFARASASASVASQIYFVFGGLLTAKADWDDRAAHLKSYRLLKEAVAPKLARYIEQKGAKAAA